MLKSLRNLDSKGVQRILADLTSSFLPNPGVGSQQRILIFDNSLYQNAREEIFGLLKLQPNDLSEEDKAKVLHFLGNELSSIILKNADVNSIKNRIGQIGALSGDLYDIDIAKSIFEFFQSMNPKLRRAHIEEAIRQADLIENPTFEGIDYVSLFLKTYNKLSERDIYSLLILSQRHGFKLKIQSVWRVYHAEIGLREVKSPLQVLKAMVDYYGVPFTVGGERYKLLAHNIFEASPGTRCDELIEPLEVKHQASFCFMRKTNIARLYEAALMFYIDLSKYVGDMNKHGEPAKIPSKADEECKSREGFTSFFI